MNNSRKRLNKIVICAGGTGGHIYPAVAVAAQILKNNPSCQILFIGTGRAIEHDILLEKGYRHESIKARGLKRGSAFGIFISLFFLCIGFIQSLVILIRIKPQAVLSMGGYFSVPVVLSSFILQIPIVIHEQNVLPGMATKISLRFASKVAVSFDETLKFIEGRDNVFVTGNPIRDEIVKVQKNKLIKEHQIDNDDKNILVIGGSLGSLSINNAVVGMLQGIFKKNISITHICGVRDFERIKGIVDNINIDCRYKGYPYLENMSEVLDACDIIVSRSGATILAEISALGIPAILIPYPYSADGHQSLNADVFEKNGAAIIIKDDLLTSELLSKTINNILCDDNLVYKMAQNSRKLYKSDADIKILELLNEAT